MQPLAQLPAVCATGLAAAAAWSSVLSIWTNPILIDETGTILAGHGRLEAAKRLGRSEVPTLTIAGLSAAEKRAVVIADNRLPEQAVWDFDLLRGHFKELIEIDFDVELTGFSTGEIDLLLDGKPPPATDDPADELTGLRSEGPAISQPGDVWQLDRHRSVCADALRSDSYELIAGLSAAEKRAVVIADNRLAGAGGVGLRSFARALQGTDRDRF